MIPGATFRLEITTLVSDGRGLGRLDGQAVFVEGALPGQDVEVEILRAGRRMLEGRCLRVLRPGTDERPAPCPHATLCGGCPWQALSYPAQLRWKEQVTRDALGRVGGLHPQIMPVLPSPQEWGYRNKMEFAVDAERRLGLRARASRQVVEVTDCRLQSPRTMRVLATLRELFAQGDSADLPWRHVVVREPLAGGCLVEAIVSPHAQARVRGEALGKALLRALPEVSGFVLSERRSRLDVAYGERTLVRLGETALVERLDRPDGPWETSPSADLPSTKSSPTGASSAQTPSARSQVILPASAPAAFDPDASDPDASDSAAPNTAIAPAPFPTPSDVQPTRLTLGLGHSAFFQVNTAAANRLYAEALRLLNPQPHETLWDVYCGVGSIGLFMAPFVARVCGVDVVNSAVTLAQANARRAGFTHCHFACGEARTHLRHFPPAQAVVVDPPRAGLHPDLIAFLLQRTPDRLLYISCNPATLARDAALLAAGYTLVELCPVDLFPQTPHVECVALFRPHSAE